MICVETIGKIRRWHRVDKLSISEIARRLSASRNTIAKYLEGDVTAAEVQDSAPKRSPVMGAWAEKLEAMLVADAQRPRKEQRTAQRLHRCAGAGRALAARIRRCNASSRRGIEEQPAQSGQRVHPAELRAGRSLPVRLELRDGRSGRSADAGEGCPSALVPSRVFLAVAYLREAQEMVFDAHWRAFSLWGGSCQRGIYDNLKTAVELIFTGKARQYNRKFLQMASHYLIEPVACTPGAGWEKGQIENQVGHVRENVFTPRLRCNDLAELNAAARAALRADRPVDPRTPSSASRPAGRCSKHPSARCWCRWRPSSRAAPSARCGSARLRWCTLIATATASIAATRARRCRCAPTPIGS